MQWQPGDALEVLGAVFWALHIVVVARYAARFDSLTFACGQFLVCGLLNLFVGFSFEPLATLFEGPVVWATLYRGILAVGVGYTVQIWAQKFTRATDAALIFSLEAVFAGLFAWWMLAEGLEWLQIVGCGLILAAAFSPQLTKKNSSL
jgi:drug/metabolite transporter (DMT)-like permease